MIAAEAIVYDALYAYCGEMVRRGLPDGQFRCSWREDARGASDLLFRFAVGYLIKQSDTVGFGP
jgi:hypothetical protein